MSNKAGDVTASRTGCPNSVLLGGVEHGHEGGRELGPASAASCDDPVSTVSTVATVSTVSMVACSKTLDSPNAYGTGVVSNETLARPVSGRCGVAGCRSVLLGGVALGVGREMGPASAACWT